MIKCERSLLRYCSTNGITIRNGYAYLLVISGVFSGVSTYHVTDGSTPEDDVELRRLRGQASAKAVVWN